MALGTPTHLGGAGVRDSGHTLAASPSTTIAVGEVAFVVATVEDRDGDASADSNALSLADSQGNTWTKLYERTFNPQVDPQADCVAAWFCRVTTAIGTGDSITVTDTLGSGGGHSRVINLNKFTTGADVDTILGTLDEGADTTPTPSISGLTNGTPYLLFGVVGAEGFRTVSAEDSDYTTLSRVVHPDGGTFLQNVATYIAYRASSTLMSDTYGMTLNNSADHAGQIVAFFEQSGAQTVSPNAVTVPIAVNNPEVDQQVVPASIGIGVSVTEPAQVAQEVAPAAVSMPIAVNNPELDQQVRMDAVSIPITVNAPTIQESGAAQQVAPGAVSLPITVETPSVTQEVTPAEIAVPLAVNAPEIDQQVRMNEVAVPVAVNAPSVNQEVVAAEIAVPLAVNAPTQITQEVTPDEVSIPVTLPAPTIEGGEPQDEALTSKLFRMRRTRRKPS